MNILEFESNLSDSENLIDITRLNLLASTLLEAVELMKECLPNYTLSITAMEPSVHKKFKRATRLIKGE